MKHRLVHDFAGILVADGLFERHPGVRVAYIENGGTWVGDLLHKLQVLHGQNPGLFSKNPVDQFHENCWVAPFVEDTVPELAEHIPVERILFGSDWPHAEGIAHPRDFFEKVEDVLDRGPAQDHGGERARAHPRVALVSEYPFGVGVIDTMISFPSDPEQVYGVMRQAFRDRESREDFVMPAAYMFKDVPEDLDRRRRPGRGHGGRDGPPRHRASASIERRARTPRRSTRALASTPTGSSPRGRSTRTAAWRAIRELERAHAELGVRAASLFPAGVIPQVPINDKR